MGWAGNFQASDSMDKEKGKKKKKAKTLNISTPLQTLADIARPQAPWDVLSNQTASLLAFHRL